MICSCYRFQQITILLVPIPGRWTKWSKFGECGGSIICGGSIQNRTRTCTVIDSGSIGSPTCEGDATQSRRCNTEGCTGKEKRHNVSPYLANEIVSV